jgi:hypothetical protein
MAEPVKKGDIVAGTIRWLIEERTKETKKEQKTNWSAWVLAIPTSITITAFHKTSGIQSLERILGPL